MNFIIKLALETAMLREEISNLCWSAIDLERRTATLFVTKNGEPAPSLYRPRRLKY